MIYGFKTNNEATATAALILYAAWRSRDRTRIKDGYDIWARVDRFLKDAAKRSRTTFDFIEGLTKPGRLYAAVLHPKYLALGMAGDTPLVQTADGAFIQFSGGEDRREFGVDVFENADHRAVVREAYRNHKYVIMLVRDRLEREKSIEHVIENIVDEDWS